MVGINMRELSCDELTNVSGAGWDSFWESVGEAVGEMVAGSAYSKASKEAFDTGAGKGSESLDSFLNNQNDPLL